ncbi:hypothetical protein AB3S75_003719 [Citrus x aurantiifolia]
MQHRTGETYCSWWCMHPGAACSES